MLRLPAFLHHYRKLGVDRFFIVDNGSSDGTADYLLQQPNVHVFRTEGRYREAQGGLLWLNALLAAFGLGAWCVTVDADELLYYPGSEEASLRPLTRYLDARGSEALQCLLLDMYPASALAACRYSPGEALQSAAPYFDSGPYVRSPAQRCPGVFTVGGPRQRVFYPETINKGLRRRGHEVLYERILPHLPGIRSNRHVKSRWPRQSPCLTKVPLVRWDDDSRYLESTHFVSPKLVAVETGALLHFKFLQDFHDKAMREVQRREYFDGASEYRRYVQVLRSKPDLGLMYEGSVRFENSAQLTELGLMHDSATWAEERRTATEGRGPMARGTGDDNVRGDQALTGQRIP